jgi:O-antigen/teichoic acid export membrane protein
MPSPASPRRFAWSPHRARQLWYAPVLTLAMALMFVRSLVMARLLDVEAFGQYSAGILVSATFCMLGCLGLQSMLQREWPVHLVRGRERSGPVRAAQCHLVAAACCAAGLLACAAGFAPAGMPALLVAMGLVHGLTQQVFLVATTESRSRGEALRFAWQTFVRTLGGLVLSAAVAAWTGSPSATLAIDASMSLVLSIAYFSRSLVRAHLGWLTVFRLAARRLPLVRWRSALTLMAAMVLTFGVLNVDRWVAADRLAVGVFAQYSFACLVLTVAQSAQAVINASIYPLLARRFASHGRDVAFRVCVQVSVASFVFSAVLALPAYYLLEGAIGRWYPQYGDAVRLLPWFLAIAAFRMSDFWSSFLLIVGKEGRLLRANLAACGTAIAAWALLARPWHAGPVSPQQVAWLAVLLTLFAYAAVAAAAWRTRRAR